MAHPDGPQTRIALMYPLASAACAVVRLAPTVNAPMSSIRFIARLLSFTEISVRVG